MFPQLQLRLSIVFIWIIVILRTSNDIVSAKYNAIGYIPCYL
jgi:hypothetical protein